MTETAVAHEIGTVTILPVSHGDHRRGLGYTLPRTILLYIPSTSTLSGRSGPKLSVVGGISAEAVIGVRQKRIAIWTSHTIIVKTGLELMIRIKSGNCLSCKVYT